MTHGTETAYEAVWPLGRSTARPVQLSRRLDDPGDKRIGFVWDYVLRGDEMFAIAQQELRRQFPEMTFVDYPAFGNIHGPDERDVMAALPQRLRAEDVDAVVIGVGA
jgi:hypothetical protein